MQFLEPLLVPLTLAAILGSGLIGGTFFAFSNFVMPALARVPSQSGVAAMQAINVVVLNPLFLGFFLGTGAVSLLLLAYAVTRWDHPAACWWLVGSVLYLLGNVFVTMAFNVPRNNGLAELDPADPSTAAAWKDYITVWTRWNHVRTITALAATACFAIALMNISRAVESKLRTGNAAERSGSLQVADPNPNAPKAPN